MAVFQFGLIYFSNNVKVEFKITDPASDSLESLLVAIDNAQGQEVLNLTGTPPALNETAAQLTMYDRDDALFPDVLFFMTDGHITPPTSQEENEAFLRPFAERVKENTEYVFGLHQLNDALE